MSTHTSQLGVRALTACVALALLGMGADTAPGGCSSSGDEAVAAASVTPSPSAVPTAEPVAATPAPVATEPLADAPALPAPPPLAIERTPPSPLQIGWATLSEHADPDQRAWVEGEVVNGDEFTINTANVRRFTLDLARVRLNWSKRIVLRMDGFNSELTRKRYPTLNFVRSPAGAWDVVAD